MDFPSLAHFAAHLIETKIRVHEAEEAVIERACEIVEEGAKGALGTYAYGWPSLAPSTLARKSADTPGVETGEMRDSVSHTVSREHGEFVGYVGSNDQNAIYFELGTSKQPPRSFLMESALRNEGKIVEMAGRAMAAAVSDGETLSTILEIAGESVHRLKELGKELVEPPPDSGRRDR